MDRVEVRLELVKITYRAGLQDAGNQATVDAKKLEEYIFEKVPSEPSLESIFGSGEKTLVDEKPAAVPHTSATPKSKKDR